MEERATLYLLPLEGVTVGETVVAALTHPSAQLRVVSWQWQRSVDGAQWQVIEGADEGNYVPIAADAGHLLRVIVSYQTPDGGLELAGMATARLPGNPEAPVVEVAPEPTPEAKSEAAQSVQPGEEPTPLPVAAATPVPTASPAPAPVPTQITIPASTAAPGPAVAGTRAPFLESASSLASRGLGAGVNTEGSRPDDESVGAAAGSSGFAQQSAAAPQGQDAAPLERENNVPGAPETGGQPAALPASGAVMVWVVLAVFATLVVGGGFGYYRLRMRRR